MVSSGTEATMSAHPPGARLHRPRQDRQVRGLLPRPRRLPAGQGRLRRADPRRAQLARACPPRSPSSPSPCPTTTSIRYARPLPSIGDEIACIIVEPVAGNMNCIPPVPGFLEGLREVCDQHGAAADLRRGHDRLPRRARRRPGALRHHARPDHARQDHRRRHAGRRLRRQARRSWSTSHRSGPVYQAGTLSGNPGRHGRRPARHWS